MVIVECMGGVWKMSDLRYRKFLIDCAADTEDKGFELDSYGTFISHTVVSVTDLTPKMAEEFLVAFTESKKKNRKWGQINK